MAEDIAHMCWEAGWIWELFRLGLTDFFSLNSIFFPAVLLEWEHSTSGVLGICAGHRSLEFLLFVSRSSCCAGGDGREHPAEGSLAGPVRAVLPTLRRAGGRRV